jgi:signal transduction histidine kinase
MLAAGIAHNISSPLMVISGYAQLLKTKLPKVKEFDVILSQIDKISEITRNMMIKSRSEQDKAVKPIDLNELLRTELKFLEANLQFKSKIEKQYHYDPELPKLNGVYSDFSQAFSNIINNALDAMYSRSIRKLTVTTRHTSTENIVEISDTGGGIPPENLERIFDPFFTTKPPVGAVKEGEPTGTGLGLSTSQQLIGNYHGRIEVTSDYGIGTTFKIILPIDIPSAIEAPLPTPVDSNSGELLEVAK